MGRIQTETQILLDENDDSEYNRAKQNSKVIGMTEAQKIKKAILAKYPGFSVKRERIQERSSRGVLEITRTTLVTPLGNIYFTADGPNYEGSLRNLAYRAMVTIPE